MCSVLPKQNSRHDLGRAYDCIKHSDVNPFPHQRCILKACWPDMLLIHARENTGLKEKINKERHTERERERERDGYTYQHSAAAS